MVAARIFLFAYFIASPFFCTGWEPIPPNTPGHEWMDRVVEEEFARFKDTGITKKMIDDTMLICVPDGDMSRYKIINSTVYGRHGNFKNILEAMVKVYRVPDVDFIYFSHDILRDYTLDNQGLTESSPIFVSAKSRSFDRAIAFIDWYYCIGNQGLNALIASMNRIQDKYPWPKKIEKVIWRGAGTDGCYALNNWTQMPRGRLVYYSKYLYPDLIDAGFASLPPLHTNDRDGFSREIGFAGWVTPEDHVKFKYQIILDGITCTYPGSQWRLFSGCLTFKHESDDIMWFYKDMIPWKHYIPLNYDISDLVEKIIWAKNHDEEARQIAMNAREFALTHLMPEHILLYCYKALVKYASLQTFQPSLD